MSPAANNSDVECELQPINAKIFHYSQMNHLVTDLDRLDRIEQKLDRITDALADLARLGARQDALAQRLDRHEFRLDLIEDQTNATSETLAKSAGQSRLIERAAWLVFAAALSVVASQLP